MTKKTASDWCSKYCRLRDALAYCKKYGIDLFQFSRPQDIIVKCCSCHRVASWIRMDAGHYFSRGIGGGSGAYFDERNIHAQCRYCNGFNEGSRQEYQEFMLETYGQETLDALLIVHKMRIQPLPFVIGQYYKERYKELLAKLN